MHTSPHPHFRLVCSLSVQDCDPGLWSMHCEESSCLYVTGFHFLLRPVFYTSELPDDYQGIAAYCPDFVPSGKLTLRTCRPSSSLLKVPVFSVEFQGIASFSQYLQRSRLEGWLPQSWLSPLSALPFGHLSNDLTYWRWLMVALFCSRWPVFSIIWLGGSDPCRRAVRHIWWWLVHWASSWSPVWSFMAHGV